MKIHQSTSIKTVLLLFSLFMLIGSDCKAQQKTSIEFNLKPHFNALIVHNIDTAVNWYKEMFQLHEIDRVEFNGIQVSILEDKGKSLAMELLQFPYVLSPSEALKGQPLDTKIAGYFKVGFTINNFDAWVKFLEDKKVKLIVKVQKDNKTGKRNFIISDKDGNLLQFMER